MNIYDLARRPGSKLFLSQGVQPVKRQLGDEMWRGLVIPPGGEIRVPDILRLYPFRERPSHCDWYAHGEGRNAATSPVLAVSLKDSDNGGVVSTTSTVLGPGPSQVLIPWPLSKSPLPANVDLILSNSAGAASGIFIAVHRVISRDALFANALGLGVEIGPGANPQLRSDGSREVYYLEQMPAEEWRRLYRSNQDDTFDERLWRNYRLGEAHELPFEDGSLDFIFSSHVFEHLVNPLGHLKHWRSKLRAGGVVLGVVPDLAGARDQLQSLSSLSDAIEEYRRDLWAPTEEHYRRYLAKTNPAIDPLDWLRERRSIHVHFYTYGNMAELLSYACSELGYSGFHIRHAPNHKDFHFMLAAT